MTPSVGNGRPSQFKLLSSRPNRPFVPWTSKSWKGRTDGTVGWRWTTKKPKPSCCRFRPSVPLGRQILKGTDGWHRRLAMDDQEAQAKLLLLSPTDRAVPWIAKPWGRMDGQEGQVVVAKTQTDPTNRPHRWPAPNLGRDERTDMAPSVECIAEKPSRVKLLSSSPTVRPYRGPPPNLERDRRHHRWDGWPRSQAKLLSSSPTDRPSAPLDQRHQILGQTDGTIGGWVAKRPSQVVVVISDRPYRGPPNLGRDRRMTPSVDGWPRSQAKLSSSPIDRPCRGPPNLGMDG
ncbi:hypothetical protein [Mollivirus kamchatka]|nr:hypothetical protein [Mollivirus kamchatka]